MKRHIAAKNLRSWLEEGYLDGRSMYLSESHNFVWRDKLEKMFRAVCPKEIRSLPLFQWRGRVEILSTYNETMAAINKLLQEKIIGFDVEYSPYQQPALVQMATEKCVYLFRTLQPKRRLKLLKPILESSEILKVGVGVNSDLARLRPFDLSPCNFTDVPDITRPLGIQQGGLQNLSAIILGKLVSKKKPKSKSWIDSVLCPKQVAYAATDAHAARKIYIEAVNR